MTSRRLPSFARRLLVSPRRAIAANQRGDISVETIVTLVIALLVLSQLLPTAFDTFFAVDTSGWDTGTAAVWLLIPILAILAIALRFYKRRNSA